MLLTWRVVDQTRVLSIYPSGFRVLAPVGGKFMGWVGSALAVQNLSLMGQGHLGLYIETQTLMGVLG